MIGRRKPVHGVTWWNDKCSLQLYNSHQLAHWSVWILWFELGLIHFPPLAVNVQARFWQLVWVGSCTQSPPVATLAMMLLLDPIVDGCRHVCCQGMPWCFFVSAQGERWEVKWNKTDQPMSASWTWAIGLCKAGGTLTTAASMPDYELRYCK